MIISLNENNKNIKFTLEKQIIKLTSWSYYKYN